MTSKYLNSFALKGLNKVGDIFLPGMDEFPSFSKLGCANFIDQVVEDLPPSDRDGVGILFMVFYFLPGFLLKWLFGYFERVHNTDVMAGSIIRMVRLGVRGIIYSLYYSGWKGPGYSGKAPLDIIGYQLNIIRD